MTRKIVEEVAARGPGPDLIVGIADDMARPLAPPLRGLMAGPLFQLGTIIEQLRPDRIVVALADRPGRLPMRELLEARVRGIAVEDAIDLYERLTGKLAIESLTRGNLISSRDFCKTRLERASSRAASVVASAIGLVILAPLLVLIALIIKLDSSGPAFFLHDRVGLGGRRFKLIKFRTMRSAQGATSEWVRDNDHRITRVGFWLRKFRLDEIPQLLNVICGEMNLVGPRPHPVTNFMLFRQTIPYYSLRTIVRPGVTGWAQVTANNLEEETEKMRYDLYYIKHMSPWLDMRILAQTVKTVLCETARKRPISGVTTAVSGKLKWVQAEDAPRELAAPSDRVAARSRQSEASNLRQAQGPEQSRQSPSSGSRVRPAPPHQVSV